MTIKEITELRKNGQLQEALEAAEAEYAKSQNTYTLGALLWCLIDQSKDRQEGDPSMPPRMEALHKELSEKYDAGALDESMHTHYAWLIYYALKNTDINESDTRKTLMAKYLKLNTERPSVLHSLILSEAVKLERNAPQNLRLRDFLKLWGIENLRDDDWQQFRTDDGKVIPSLVEKLIGAYTKEMRTDRTTPTEDFCRLLDKAIETFPNNPNMPYFKASALIALGLGEEAMSYYKDLLLKTPGKSYLWSQASDLVEDLDQRIGLLCRAVNTGEDEGFIGGARLKLARALIERGYTPNAKAELERYRRTYEERGWRLKQDYWDLAKSIYNVQPEDNRLLYTDYGALADAYVYSALPSTYAVKVMDKIVDDRLHPGKKYAQWTLKADTETLWLKKPRKFALDTRTPNGTVLEVKVKDGKIVWAKKAEETPQLEWLRTATGEVKTRTDRNGHRYSLIDGVYVNEALLGNAADGDTLTVTALRQPDGRWTALSRQNL